MDIRFNKPYMTGKALWYIEQTHTSSHLAGDGQFTRKCSSSPVQRIGSQYDLQCHTVFVDIRPDTPNTDKIRIAGAVTPRAKVVAVKPILRQRNLLFPRLVRSERA